MSWSTMRIICIYLNNPASHAFPANSLLPAHLLSCMGFLIKELISPLPEEEDLDFTLTQSMSIDETKSFVEEINYHLQEAIGIRTDSRGMSIEDIEDEYGKESFEVKIFYDGPSDYGGSFEEVLSEK